MRIREHLRRNIVLALPVIIGQLGHIMVSVADSLMVGRLGVIPLAGATFAGPFHHPLLLFGIGVSYAITPLVAATAVENKSKMLGFLQNAFLLNTIMGIILVAIGLFSSQFLQFFGQEDGVVAAAGPYLIIISLSILPVMIFQSFRQYSEGRSNTLAPMVVSIFGNVLNVLLNYMLIYGKFGFEAYGLNGAGYATLISRILMAILMIWLIRKSWEGFEWSFQMEGIKKLLKIGIPSGMQYIFEVGAFAGASIMVGWISAEALAAHNIALNLSAVTYMASTGLAAASTIRVGNQIGRKNRKDLRMAGFSIMGMVVVFMSFCGLLFIFLRHWLPTLYIEDNTVQALTSSILIVAAAFQISDGLQAVGLGVLRGLTDVKIPTVVTFVAFWLMALPLGYVFAFKLELGVNGIWYSLSLGLTVAAILHFWRFNRLTKNLEFEED